MATRRRKGHWRMSRAEIVRKALNTYRLEEQRAPDMEAICIVLLCPGLVSVAQISVAMVGA